MLHLYASEVAAAASLVLFVLIIWSLWLFRVGWSREATLVDLLVLVLSCAFGCRTAAKGKLCQWPSGVDFTGRVALVVGASSGVGYSTAEQLAQHGWTVILAGRNADRLLFAKKAIERRLQRHRSKGEVKVLGTVDLRSDASIRAYAAELEAVKAKLPIGLLVMAAGALHRHAQFVGAVPELQSGAASVTTSAAEWRSMECMLASNAVGPFLLTQLLLPLLDDTAERSSVTSRIVNVGSSCHTYLGVGRQTGYNPLAMIRGLDKRGGEVVSSTHTEAVSGQGAAPQATEAEGVCDIRDFGWLSFVNYYGLSKLCVMWNTRLLAQQVSMLRFKKTTGLKTPRMRKAVVDGDKARKPSDASPPAAVTGENERQNQLKIFVACAHPGISVTYLYRDLFSPRVLDFILYYPSLIVGKTWFESAQSTLKAAVEDTEMVHGGYYLCGGEYGPESGVNCVSAHAQNPAYLQEYREWLMRRVTPALQGEEKSKGE